MDKLRSYIREVLLREAKYVVVYSPLQSDLEQALYWLQNNKQVKTRGAIHQEGDVYIARIKPKGSKADVEKLVSDRFGRFVRVR